MTAAEAQERRVASSCRCWPFAGPRVRFASRRYGGRSRRAVLSRARNEARLQCQAVPSVRRGARLYRPQRAQRSAVAKQSRDGSLRARIDLRRHHRPGRRRNELRAELAIRSQRGSRDGDRAPRLRTECRCDARPCSQADPRSGRGGGQVPAILDAPIGSFREAIPTTRYTRSSSR